jgi:hypothetical protein
MRPAPGVVEQRNGCTHLGSPSAWPGSQPTAGRSRAGTPGDVFGLETRRDHTLSAKAIDESNLLLIRRSAIVALAEREQDVASSTVDAHRIRAPKGPGSYPAICIAGAGACRSVEMAQRLSANDEVVLPMLRQDIADYLGATLETAGGGQKAFPGFIAHAFRLASLPNSLAQRGVFRSLSSSSSLRTWPGVSRSA